MSKRTEREQNIEQVALRIAEARDLDPTCGLAEVTLANHRGGWSFEVRYDTHEYHHAEEWTEVEGLILSDTDLQQAFDLAVAWADPLKI